MIKKDQGTEAQTFKIRRGHTLANLVVKHVKPSSHGALPPAPPREWTLNNKIYCLC